MPLTENKDIIQQFYHAMNSRDIESILNLYAPNAMIEVFHIGPYAGKRPASEEGLKAFFSAFPEIEFTIDTLVSENNQVSVQVRSNGKLADGSAYSNRYHNYFRLENSKIVLFNEYPES